MDDETRACVHERTPLVTFDRERRIDALASFVTRIKWHEFTFTDTPYETFARSLDLYNDGAVVLVPLAGHTPGSIGLFVTVDSGRRVFFCGDAVWNAKAIARSAPKMFWARLMVDDDASLTQSGIEKLRDLARARPEITIVPAHDGAVQDAVGIFRNSLRNLGRALRGYWTTIVPTMPSAALWKRQ